MKSSEHIPEQVSDKPTAPLTEYERNVLETMEEGARLDEEREHLVGSPSEVDYLSALDYHDSPPAQVWRESRQESRVTREHPVETTTVQEVERPTAEELASRQRFIEFTRYREEMVAREQARQFAVEQPPHGLRGLLTRFKVLFRERGASYAKVPPLPTVMGATAIVSVAAFR